MTSCRTNRNGSDENPTVNFLEDGVERHAEDDHPYTQKRDSFGWNFLLPGTLILS